MKQFTLEEHKEPFNLKEVIDFIDDEATDISKLDAYELKCRIVDMVQAERNKAIDEFAERLKYEHKQTITTASVYVKASFDEVVDEIAEQLKGGGDKPQ